MKSLRKHCLSAVALAFVLLAWAADAQLSNYNDMESVMMEDDDSFVQLSKRFEYAQMDRDTLAAINGQSNVRAEKPLPPKQPSNMDE